MDILSDKKIRYALWFILFFSFFIRIMGISYGLPLWLIDDEATYPLSTLKMIQLHTLLPILHLGEFKPILNYAPYLSIFYVPFYLVFLLLYAIWFLMHGGVLGNFVHYVALDFSQFFLITRVLNVIFATVTVYLIYRASLHIFKRPIVGLLGSFFLGTSLLHSALSMTGRHWVPFAFLLSLCLVVLTHPEWSFRRRYISAALIAGIGIGMDTSAVLIAFLIPCVYLFYEQRSFVLFFKEKVLWVSAIIIFVLSVFQFALYPAMVFVRDVTTPFGVSKSIQGFLINPFLFIKPIAISEPILIIFFIFGLFFVFQNKRNLFWTSFVYIYI